MAERRRKPDGSSSKVSRAVTIFSIAGAVIAVTGMAITIFILVSKPAFIYTSYSDVEALQTSTKTGQMVSFKARLFLDNPTARQLFNISRQNTWIISDIRGQKVDGQFITKQLPTVSGQYTFYGKVIGVSRDGGTITVEIEKTE